jgi:hypothetical protein
VLACLVAAYEARRTGGALDLDQGEVATIG